mmetsp:Transcript_27267/g.84486  ORF Transcript_27267/g.84486 Transcript_27267/m.84486 type:complete len:414 (-) Transcript_27267:123-1364(-)
MYVYSSRSAEDDVSDLRALAKMSDTGDDSPARLAVTLGFMLLSASVYFPSGPTPRAPIDTGRAPGAVECRGTASLRSRPDGVRVAGVPAAGERLVAAWAGDAAAACDAACCWAASCCCCCCCCSSIICRYPKTRLLRPTRASVVARHRAPPKRARMSLSSCFTMRIGRSVRACRRLGGNLNRKPWIARMSASGDVARSRLLKRISTRNGRSAIFSVYVLHSMRSRCCSSLTRLKTAVTIVSGAALRTTASTHWLTALSDGPIAASAAFGVVMHWNSVPSRRSMSSAVSPAAYRSSVTSEQSVPSRASAAAIMSAPTSLVKAASSRARTASSVRSSTASGSTRRMLSRSRHSCGTARIGAPRSPAATSAAVMPTRARGGIGSWMRTGSTWRRGGASATSSSSLWAPWATAGPSW